MSTKYFESRHCYVNILDPDPINSYVNNFTQLCYMFVRSWPLVLSSLGRDHTVHYIERSLNQGPKACLVKMKKSVQSLLDLSGASWRHGNWLAQIKIQDHGPSWHLYIMQQGLFFFRYSSPKNI